MRLVTFDNRSGAERLGALFDGDSRVADLAEAHRLRTGAISPHLVSMQALIEGGPAALELAAAALEQARRAGAGVVPRADIRLRAPLPRPIQMRDFLCFEQHLRNSFARALDLYTAGAADPKKARAEPRGLRPLQYPGGLVRDPDLLQVQSHGGDRAGRRRDLAALCRRTRL